MSLFEAPAHQSRFTELGSRVLTLRRRRKAQSHTKRRKNNIAKLEGKSLFKRGMFCADNYVVASVVSFLRPRWRWRWGKPVYF